MADTSVSEPITEPRTNGVAEADETEEERAKLRPADIDAVSVLALRHVTLSHLLT